MLEVFGLASSLVSLILGGFAIWLSWQFYDKSRTVDTSVQLALKGIQTETAALQALTVKYLDRLTRFVTTPRDESTQTSELLATTLRDLPDIVLKLRFPADTSNEPAMRREIVSCYLLIWYYCATTNLWAGYSLRSIELFDENDSYDQLVKHIVDNSAADFRAMRELIDQLSPGELAASSYEYLYRYTDEQLAVSIGDTTEKFARRAKA